MRIRTRNFQLYNNKRHYNHTVAVHNNRGKQDAIHPVKHTAMAGEERAKILDAAIAFYHTGKQIAHLRSYAAHKADHQVSPHRRERLRWQYGCKNLPNQPRKYNTAHKPADGAGHRFVRADLGA